MSSRKAGVSILSLDGGSIPSGASRILVLRELMRRVQDVENREDEPTPAQYFSMFSGSGVGAILSILFGRFGFSCDTAMIEYTNIAQAFSSTKEDGSFDESKLKEAIQMLSEKYVGDRNALLLDEKRESKVFVCCSNPIGNNIRKFHSYPVKKQSSPGITIWQAVMAAMASPSMFPSVPIEISGIEETFIGAPEIFQNPIMEAFQEGEGAFGKQSEISAIVSMGGGRNLHFQAGDGHVSSSLGDMLQRISSISDIVHQQALQRFEDSDIYFRFNVDATDFDRGAWSSPFRSESLSQASSYRTSFSDRLDECGRCLSLKDGKVEFTELNRTTSAESLPKPRPPVSRQYVEREEVHDFIFSKIFPSRLSLKQRRCILHGTGGSGKSQAMLNFIQRYEDRIWRVFYVDASNEKQIQTDLQTAIRSLGRRYKDKVWQDALQLLACEKRPWLLVFDNADDPKLPLQHYFPDCDHGSVLVTTRNREGSAWAPDSAYQIKEMTDMQAVALLHAAANLYPSSNETSLQIVRDLGCFALAIAQAGGYILRTRNLESYIGIFRTRRNSLMSEGLIQGDTRYNLSVYAAWELSFGLLDARVQSFISLCSKLHHSLIPRSIFERGRESKFRHTLESELPPPDNWEELADELFVIGGDDFALDQITRQLSQCSLMDIIVDLRNQIFFTFHSLVHKWAASRKREDKHNLLLAVRLLSSSITDDQSEDGYTQRRELIPHVMALSLEDLMRNARDSRGFALVLQNAGQWTTSLQLYEHILAVSKDVLGQDHFETSASSSYVAGLYRNLGRYQEAEPLDQAALRAAALHKGKTHNDTLHAMRNLAHTYRLLGRHEKAEKLNKQVVDLRMKKHGKRHPDTIKAMGDLAGTYRDLGQHEKAVELKNQVVDLRMELFGQRHPDTITAMGNLATSYISVGRYQEAVELSRKTCELREELLGGNHPDTLLSLSNYAIILQRSSRMDESIEILRDLMQVQSKFTGPRHPDTLRSIHALTRGLRKTGKLEEALDLETGILKIAEEVLGSSHPHTIMYRNGLKEIRSRLGEVEENVPTSMPKSRLRALAFWKKQ